MFRSEKQKEYWFNSTHRWNVKTGATRSGKTYMDYFLIPKRLMDVKGEEGLNVILGNTRETLRRNIILPLQNLYGEERVSNIRSDNSCTMFGERVFVLGADNISHVNKIRGMSIKYCYGDEVTTWNKEVFNMLKSRLDKPYSIFDGTCNPDSPLHWFKEFLDSDADIYQQEYQIDDNPFLPPEFITNLKKEYEGTVYYGRYIQGKWVLAEGLVFPRFEDAIYDKTPVNPDDGKEVPVSEYCISLDYGTENPFAGMLWEKRKNVWYGINELYYSGRDTGIQKTDGDYLEMLQDFSQPAKEFYNKHKKPGAFGGTYKEQIPIIIDPSAASMIALLRKSGEFKVIPADNSVLDGIRNTNLAIQKGLIKIHKRCKNWQMEAQSYVWDEKSTEDKPVKTSDHLQDAVRYFVQTKQIVNIQKEYHSLFGGR